MARTGRQEAPAGAGAKRTGASRGAGRSSGGAAGQQELQKRGHCKNRGIAKSAELQKRRAAMLAGGVLVVVVVKAELQNPLWLGGWLVGWWAVVLVLV